MLDNRSSNALLWKVRQDHLASSRKRYTDKKCGFSPRKSAKSHYSKLYYVSKVPHMLSCQLK